MTLMSLGLASGVALADNHSSGRRESAPAVRDHRGNGNVARGNQRGVERGYDRGFQRGFERGERREDRVESYRNYNARPAIRFERHEDRAGFRFIAGEWQWNGYEWAWIPGHYVRAGFSFGFRL